MSTVRMSSLKSKNSDGAINIASGDTLYYPGKIAQVVQIRSDAHLTYSSPNTGNGTTITALRMTIVPKFANSLLAINFMINGELHQDNVFLMHRNDSLITDTSHQGFNNAAGNVRSSGIVSGRYDQNEDSTPSSWFLQYFVPAVDISSRTYAPAVRGSGASNYTLALNRTLNGASQDAYERMVSTGTIMEILQ